MWMVVVDEPAIFSDICDVGYILGILNEINYELESATLSCLWWSRLTVVTWLKQEE